MRIKWAAGRFHPHEPARAEALAGVALASFGSRLAAYAIDLVVATVLYSPFYILWNYIWQRRHGIADQNIRIVVHLDFHEIWGLAFIVLYFGLSIYWGKGQTIGKRLLGIRVMSLVGDRITLWQAVERALGYGASALEGGFGFAQYFIHGNHCCVHDRIAETIVVKERSSAKATASVDSASSPEEELDGEIPKTRGEDASEIVAGVDGADEDELRAERKASVG